MTNYEWLIQTDNMCDFLRRLVDEEITELNHFYKTSFIDNGFRHSEDFRAVVNWLQSERVLLVKLADVREIITKANTTTYSNSNGVCELKPIKYEGDTIINGGVYK